MRSWIGRVVFGLGGFLVVAGLLGLVWAPGVVEKTPVDVKTITYLDGEAGKLDASTGELVRNPIFAAFLIAFLGFALMVPNPVAIAGAAVMVTGIQVQVRLVEEPYLRRVHGAAYTDYASRVGRFLPGLGRLQPEHQH